jgi:hypothetical protein
VLEKRSSEAYETLAIEGGENMDRASIVAACEACFTAHRNDCSGFARTVGARVDVPLAGLANDIVNTLRAGGQWQTLANGIEANKQAEAGAFVIGGMRGDEQVNHDIHGHVVVVVGGAPLAHGRYPAGWWGSLGGHPGQNETVNYAWTEADRDRVTYAVWTEKS